jgi:hypothetical protein
MNMTELIAPHAGSTVGHSFTTGLIKKLAATGLGQKAATNAAFCTGSLLAWAVCASILLGGVGATEAAGSPTEVRTEIGRISQTRGVQGRCNIGLNITGQALASKVAIFKVRVLRAMDDTGADLTLPGGESQSACWVSGGDWSVSVVRGWWDTRSAITRGAWLELAAAAPGAKHIANLEGELELLAPTFQNGGVVSIAEFRLHPGEPLEETRLKKYGVALTYLDKETYEATKAASGNGTNASRQGPPGMENPADMLFSGLIGAPNGLARNYVVLMLNDPQQRVAGFAFQADGRLLPVGNPTVVDKMMGFHFDTALPERLSLLVYLAVPEAVERVPFSLKDIPLPPAE